MKAKEFIQEDTQKVRAFCLLYESKNPSKPNFSFRNQPFGQANTLFQSDRDASIFANDVIKDNLAYATHTEEICGLYDPLSKEIFYESKNPNALDVVSISNAKKIGQVMDTYSKSAGHQAHQIIKTKKYSDKRFFKDKSLNHPLRYGFQRYYHNTANVWAAWLKNYGVIYEMEIGDAAIQELQKSIVVTENVKRLIEHVIGEYNADIDLNEFLNVFQRFSIKDYNKQSLGSLYILLLSIVEDIYQIVFHSNQINKALEVINNDTSSGIQHKNQLNKIINQFLKIDGFFDSSSKIIYNFNKKRYKISNSTIITKGVLPKARTRKSSSSVVKDTTASIDEFPEEEY